MSELSDRTEDRSFRKTGEPPLEHVPFSSLGDMAQALRAENAKLRAALEAVEWHGDVTRWDGTLYAVCPWCNAAEEEGHDDECQRQVALEGKW